MSFVAIKTRIQTRKWTDVNWVQWISGHLYCWMIKSIYNSVLFPPVIASWTCKPIENQYYCWFVKLLAILNHPGRTHNHMESHHKLTIKQAFIYLSLKWNYFSWLNLIIDIILELDIEWTLSYYKFLVKKALVHLISTSDQMLCLDPWRWVPGTI